MQTSFNSRYRAMHFVNKQGKAVHLNKMGDITFLKISACFENLYAPLCRQYQINIVSSKRKNLIFVMTLP